MQRAICSLNGSATPGFGIRSHGRYDAPLRSAGHYEKQDFAEALNDLVEIDRRWKDSSADGVPVVGRALAMRGYALSWTDKCWRVGTRSQIWRGDSRILQMSACDGSWRAH
jgi:hypothetical protein